MLAALLGRNRNERLNRIRLSLEVVLREESESAEIGCVGSVVTTGDDEGQSDRSTDSELCVHLHHGCEAEGDVVGISELTEVSGLDTSLHTCVDLLVDGVHDADRDVQLIGVSVTVADV